MRPADGRRTARTAAAAVLVAAVLVAAASLAGCGLAVQSPDLLALTRTGGGQTLTMVINDGGTIRCDGGAAKPLPDRLLLVARSLTGQLNPDAVKKLDPPSPPRSFYRFEVSLLKGTFSFPDTSAVHRPELAKLEAFVLQAIPSCRLRG